MDLQGDTPEYIIKERVNEDGEKCYFIKWLGYDFRENTWEPEEIMKLEWPEALKRYRSDGPIKNIPIDTPDENDTVFQTLEKIQDWEEAVERITFVERLKNGLVVYLDWKDGTKSVHHSSEVYQRCPQKMLDYYESHIEAEELDI